MKIFIERSKTKDLIGRLTFDPAGKHSAGGTPPEDFKIPTLSESPVVYCGQISKQEQHYEWLTFDLYIVCPIFLALHHPIYFDYTNPLAPEVIRGKNVDTDFKNPFPDIPGSSYIEFAKTNFRIDFGNDPNYFQGEFGVALLPDWIQQEVIPICPK